MEDQIEVTIYQVENQPVEVRLQGETVWLRHEQMADLFGRDRIVIDRHIRNVFAEDELVREAVCAKFAHTAADGTTYQVEQFNLDVIISVQIDIRIDVGRDHVAEQAKAVNLGSPRRASAA